ncbi:hypothetical protein M3Y97_00341500 [Aphelenchoides bicaudatus]|nr:hypothetical protein M3Y97_00341500 [Aphelenchoides bicaudatus]
MQSMRYKVQFSVAANRANPFLDIYLHIYPSDDFCGASQCNITYALSLLSVKLQEGLMTRNLRYTFEDNTVMRLNKGMFHTLDKIYLGLSLFDVPEDMQDYIVVDVTNVVNNKGKRARVEFITETMRVKIHVYRRNEVAETDNEEVNAVELDTEHSSNALGANQNSPDPRMQL